MYISEINQVKVSTSECVTDATRIANPHTAQIGPNLASSAPTTDPKQYLNKANYSFVIKEVTPFKVKKLLEKGDISKATGLDNISNGIRKIANHIPASDRPF